MADIEKHSSLVNRVVLVNLSFGVMGNSRNISSSVFNTDAEKVLLKGSKKLIDSPELKAIVQADAEVRAFVKDYCMPYDGGLYLLPLGFKQVVHEYLTNYATIERPELVKKFIEKYPARVTETCFRLGDLGNLKDYPSVEAVSEKFYFDYQYLSFAPPGAEMMAELTEEAKLQFQQKVTKVTDQVTMLMRQTALELVDHLKSALEPTEDGKSKRLFSSSVVNIQEFIKTFPERNITDDKELQSIITALGECIHPNFSVDVLRDDETLKTDIHGKMSEITSQLSTIVEEVPGRKFKNLKG